MGKMEKLIVVGALALVGFLLSVVLYKGLDGEKDDPNDRLAVHNQKTDYPDPGTSAPSTDPSLGSAPEVIDGVAVDPTAMPAIDPQPGPQPSDLNSAVPANAAPSGPAASLTPPPAAGAPEASLVGVDMDLDGAAEYVEYVVRSGDTLELIAKRELGSRNLWQEILKFNETLDPKRLQVGQKIRIPANLRVANAAPAGALVNQDAPAASSAASNAGTGSSGAARTHTVAAGDSLWKISVKYYGNGNHIEQIYEANKDKLASRNAVLQIGMTLRIP